jgi:hypothetical protein
MCRVLGTTAVQFSVKAFRTFSDSKCVTQLSVTAGTKLSQSTDVCNDINVAHLS